MVLTFYTIAEGKVTRYYKPESADKIDPAKMAETLMIDEDEARDLAAKARKTPDEPFILRNFVYAASKVEAVTAYQAKLSKAAAAEQKGDNEDDAAEALAKLPAGDQHFSNALSFAVKNRAINLDAVRSGFKLYMKWHDGTKEGNSLIRQFIALGIAAVARRKEDFATALLANLQALGEVPIVFAGAGGTFKAWLYLGYDILMYWKGASDELYAAAPYMKQVMSNVNRVIPGGDVTKSIDKETGGSQKIAERNRALAAARAEFALWKHDPELAEAYVMKIVGRTVVEKGDTRKAAITAYVKGAAGGANKG